VEGEIVLRHVRGMRLVGALAVGSLVLAAAGCGKPPAKNDSGSASGAAGKKLTACMVTDTGGIDDRSFNASAWKGLQDAKAENSNIDIKYVSSKAEADYEPNLTQYAQAKCGLVVAVGGLMTDATTKVAKANSDVKFAIIDSKIDLPNVYSMQFDTAQAGFLAGYLAAGMSKSGKVATYGGLKIPPVTIFMDGFAGGVDYYNKQKSKAVKVLGWDLKSQNGVFAESFIDQNKGKTIAQSFVAQGADVIMPVAGGTGLGTASEAQASGGKFSVIWVDQDGCNSASQYCPVFLSTVVKNIADAVKDATLKTADGSLSGSGSVGTLENNGVQLAPYHEFDSKVPADLKSEVDQLKQDIISGKVPVTSPAQPK
jgi:basic membrane protein A